MSITNSSKEKKNKSEDIVELGPKGYKGRFCYLVILIVLVGIGYLVYDNKDILLSPLIDKVNRMLAEDSSHVNKDILPKPTIYPENGKIEQSKAEANKDSEASESEQITLTDSEEVEEQYKAGDTFKDCDDCPEMIIVPAGEFWMGSPEDESRRSSKEGPQHKVTISPSFAVGKYEVTRGQFKIFVDATGYDAGSNWRNPGFIQIQTDTHPVVSVSWDDAKAYVSWLLQETGQKYRLLTEAEWEYVARAGTTTAYHFGDTIFPYQANYDNKKKGTVAVGSYPANAFGLHDVYGNVWEWVEDCWHNNYTGAPTDGSAWVDDCADEDYPDEDYPDEDWRVLRGGGWIGNPGILRSAFRIKDVARLRFSVIGFRIARTL